MPSHIYTHFVGVGACYIDTILTVPAYPTEDAKQRASSLTKRRGGNCPNTIEVLQQLLAIGNHKRVAHDKGTDSDSSDDGRPNTTSPSLYLISTMPSILSRDTAFIDESFSQSDSSLYHRHPVNTNYSIYRDDPDAASSYIIQSQSTNSRTIVNYNALDEMTLREFQFSVRSIIASDKRRPTPFDDTNNTPEPKTIWFHFEGRIPEVTIQCISWLRETYTSTFAKTNHITTAPQSPTGQSTTTITISVECEKPHRPGLKALAELADVVFYSRSWAEAKGHTSTTECLLRERERLVAAHADGQRCNRAHGTGRALLCCTWGEVGASALEFDVESGCENRISEADIDASMVSRPPWKPTAGQMDIVDTVGAGDSWTAGMVFGFLTGKLWTLGQRLEFANEVAGRKIMRDGFGGIAAEMHGVREATVEDDDREVQLEVTVYD